MTFAPLEPQVHERAAVPYGARLRSGIASLLDFALPQHCPACGDRADSARLLCERCLARIPRLTLPVCARCLSRAREPVGCQRHRGSQVASAWVYDERAALFVQAFKYGERPRLARALAPVLAAAVPASWPRADLIVEAALHPARRRERGYDQSALLADALADGLGVPRAPGALVRVRPTSAQARLGPLERRRNLAGAFAVPHPSRLQGRRVLVVDDVLTTGATLEAAFTALRAAGAEPAGVTLAWAQ